MISHLIPAAGVAGMIKTALALYHRVLPPTLHCDDPDPRLTQDSSPFYVNTQTRPWIHDRSTPRRAGVNAFGFGGINAHAVLEEHIPADETALPTCHREWDAEVFVVEASSRAGLISACEQLERRVVPGARMRDLAFTCNRHLDQSQHRVAIVATSPEDLTRKLHFVTDRLADPSCRRIRDGSGLYFVEEPLGLDGRLAFVFPGEGSQYPGMLADLAIHFPRVRAWFDLIDSAFAGQGRPLAPSQVIFPPPGPATVKSDAERRLWQMDYGPEAVFTSSQALLELLRELGISTACSGGPQHRGGTRLSSPLAPTASTTGTVSFATSRS